LLATAIRKAPPDQRPAERSLDEKAPGGWLPVAIGHFGSMRRSPEHRRDTDGGQSVDVPACILLYIFLKVMLTAECL
jgi:hypothetical protein